MKTNSHAATFSAKALISMLAIVGAFALTACGQKVREATTAERLESVTKKQAGQAGQTVATDTQATQPKTAAASQVGSATTSK